MAWGFIPGDVVGEVLSFPRMLRMLPDEEIRKPLWEFSPAEIPHVIHERRVRFGVFDDEAIDPEYH